MRLYALLALSCIGSAAPIYVTGSGYFDCLTVPQGGFDLDFSFSGSNGTDSVTVYADGGGLAKPQSIMDVGIANIGNLYSGAAAIDGIRGYIPNDLPYGVSFDLDGGSGGVQITSSNGVIAAVDIVGYIQVTNEVDSYGVLPDREGYGLIRVQQNFSIIPDLPVNSFAVDPPAEYIAAPEPDSWVLVVGVLLLIRRLVRSVR